MAVEGYQTKEFHGPVKRFCRTMELKNDAVLIAEYIKRHSEEEAWPEIRAGIRSVGILEMEIYIFNNLLFMIVETPIDFECESAMAKLATLPRQQEWEDLMSIFQECKKGDKAKDKWKMMNRIFHLYN